MVETQQLDAVRTRTFSWSDPMPVAAALGRRPGLELLRAMATGELPPPPVMLTLGFQDLVADEGRVTLRMPVREFHYNPLGTVHGGVLATLLDTAAGCAVHTVLPAGVGYTSLDLHTRFLRPATLDSAVLTATGTLLSKTRRSAVAEARIEDAAGRLIAHATSSCLIFEVPAGG
jgi:uncharacterized protein (TIGR00369 family)